MKKVVFALIACVFLCRQAAYAQIEVPKSIRVGIIYGEAAKEAVTITYDDRQEEYAKDDIEDEIVLTSSENIIKVNDVAYRGKIILKKAETGNMSVINEVSLEDYVAAVISREMSPSFEMEALKAQAVAARTYAIKNLKKHEKHGFSVCTGVDCQVYGGMSGEHERTIKAAYETAGEVLTYDGKLAQTVYFATSGGHTEDAKYVWGSDIPYLKGVSDKYESAEVYGAKWKREMSAAQIAEALNKRGLDLGNIINVEVLSVSPAGSVYEIKITGDKGEKIYKNESCRTFLGYDILLSQAYTVTKGDDLYIETTSGKALSSNLSILSADGTSHYKGESLYLKGTDDRALALPKESGNYIFSGRGYGHLVGMSQNGANAMAKAGFTYDEILKHYYTGTEIYKES
jgi:stage II sporulation protein D